MCSLPHSALSSLFQPASRGALTRRLKRHFPGLGTERVEDAMQTATAELLASPTALPTAWARGGVVEIHRVLVVASWRACLRALRGPRATRELLLDAEPEVPYAVTPEALLLAKEVEEVVEREMRRAARRYGGRKATQLEAALDARLGSAETDTQIAATFGVPRETLNRAKNWMAARLQAD